MERVFKHIQLPLTATDLQDRWSAQFKFLGECTDIEFFYGFDICFFPELDLFLPPREEGSLILRYTVDKGITQIDKDYLPFFFECDSIDFEKKRVCISLRDKYFIHFLKKETRQKMDELFTEYETRGKENTEAILDAIEKHEY